MKVKIFSIDWCPELKIPSQLLQFSPQKPLGAIGGVHCTKDPEPTPLFSLYIYRTLTYLQVKTNMLGIILNQFHKEETGRSPFFKQYCQEISSQFTTTLY